MRDAKNVKLDRVPQNRAARFGQMPDHAKEQPEYDRDNTDAG